MKVFMHGCIRLILSLGLSFPAFAAPTIDTLDSKIKGDQDLTDTGLKSGRYQMKSDRADSEVINYKPKKKRMIRKLPASSAAPVLDVQVSRAPTSEAPPEEEVPAPATPPPTLGEQLVDLFHGGRDQTSVHYREQIHPDDVRNNGLEVDAAAGLIYNGSSSNDSYRNYYSLAPDAKLGARFWLTPLAGVSVAYTSTFGESLAGGSPNNGVSVRSEWYDVSLDFRTFFGMSRRANSLGWGFLFNEYKLNVSGTETTRIGLRTDNLGFYVNGRIPVAPSYAWVMGLNVYPIENTAELQTNLKYSSGVPNAAYKLDLHFGGEIKMSRQNQLTWNIGTTVERTTYSGSASVVDPASGTTPSGISVTNTWTYLNLGYRWGQ